MGKPKVLFTSHVANFQKFNRPFMRMLREQGYEVHYASMGEEEILDCDKSFVVPFTRSPFKTSNIKAYKQLKEIINRENYDIIHTHTPMGSVVTRLAARDARKNGTRVIYTAHGFHFFTGAPLANWLIYYPVERYMARHTDTLITINDEDYQRAKKKFKTDVRYVPGVGVDEAKFKPRLTKKQRNDLRKTLGIKPDDFVIIYPAELSKRKRQTWLLKSLGDFIATHPDVHLLLPGGDSLNGTCQALAQRLGIDSQVHFLGYRQDIPQLMMASDLSVSSSSQEGLPVNLLEALAAELPIVATNSRGHADLVEDEVNGFVVDRNNSEVFAGKIEQLYADNTLRGRMAAISKKQLDGYRFDDVWPNVENLYKAKRRILHLLASNKFSGAESVACSIISETSNQYDVVYCSPSGEISDVLAKKKIRHISIVKLSRREIRRVINEFRPNTIHAHDFRASICASYFARDVKVISQIHQNPNWLNSANIRSLSYIHRIKKFDKVVVVTDIMKGNFTFSKAAHDRLIVLRNFVNHKLITKESKKKLSHKYDIMFCGRLENVKQPLVFLNGILQIKQHKQDVKVVMVGDGSLRSECVKFLVENDLQDNVSLVGFQDNPYKYMANSSFLFVTSSDEGFGLAAVEASLLGVVVLSFELPAIRELFPETDTTYATSLGLVDAYLKLRSEPAYEKMLSDQQESIPQDVIKYDEWIRSVEAVYSSEISA